MKTGNVQYSFFFQNYKHLRRATRFFGICLFFVCLSCLPARAQQAASNDSINESGQVSSNDTLKIKKHSPHKATLYSMILPGLGQAYNRKYWKIPIVYAGFGVFYYLIDYNNTEYQLWKDAYNHTLLDPDGLEDPVNDYEELYGDNPDFLLDRKNEARRYRDLNYILAGVWYMLNVLDATVDAHLFSWEVDDNLSLRMEPHLQSQAGSYKPMGGVKLSLNF
jgi:hypothetical protein